jgi:Protein kinase domain
MNCPTCSSDVPARSRFCPLCGSAIDPSSTPTLTNVGAPASRTQRPATTPREKAASSAGTLSLSDSNISGGARFVPGAVLLERKGGMGEVYRADDLRLSQTVALKFLPEAVAKDGAALARFHREVRIARQVSHANVCRVFDIGEVDGLPFLTMEYVDGEDLASLMRRIGRLGPDKALEISRQVCAGLAAAHEHGILHRDLKPANVMLDGRGKVRITDFGLAGLGDDMRHEDASAGTPAYMAPEQLSGKEVTQKSDIYSLGLVLYEIFTGKRAFEAASMKELLRVREASSPTNPSAIVKDIDPLVERVILRCLEKDPAKRPPTALQVAAALPGGDPLAAALAAGETPSPEMVAAAGETEVMSSRAAWACVAAIVVISAVTITLAQQMKLFRFVPFEKPPEVLIERARAIESRLGYTTPPVDSAQGFTTDSELLNYIAQHDTSRTRWDNLDRGEMSFWYRESPRPMIAVDFFGTHLTTGAVSRTDPHMEVSGMTLVTLNPRGRLLQFEAVPPQVEKPVSAAPAPDWSVLFAEAGLDMGKWAPTEPNWTPNTYCDARAAWTGTWPGRPEPLRIEAAAYRGKPVHFQIIGPWTRPERMQVFKSTAGQHASNVILILLFISLMIGATLGARSNLRQGRGDRRGASRLASFVFAMMAVSWLFGANHVASFTEVGLVILAASWALFISGLTWLLYIALEPFVRRFGPTILISWSRLLAGGFRDPLVGRDVLMGCLAGVTFSLLGDMQSLMPKWMGYPPPQPDFFPTFLLMGVRPIVSISLWQIVQQVFFSLAVMFLLLFMKAILRKQWAASAAVVLLMSALPILQADLPLLFAPFAILIWALLVFVLIRFGLVAVTSILLFSSIVDSFPITTETTAWYAGIGYLGIFLMAVMVFYGFHTARGSKPLFAAVPAPES